METSQTPYDPTHWHGTTILCVRKDNKVVLVGDGQVTMGNTVVKSNAKKLRRLGNGSVIGGFAGATADALTLFSSRAPRSSSPRIGAPTGTCAGSKR
jgi:ATP-dependent HslUV protease subunit HslV